MFELGSYQSVIGEVNGFINLRKMSWNFKRNKKYTRISKSCSQRMFTICMIFILVLIFDSLTFVNAAPASNSKSNSRSIRESNNSALFKNFQSTTLHSLQGVGDSGSSLSIVSSIDVLRQNMVMEIMRRRIRHAKQRQLQSNQEILDRIG